MAGLPHAVERDADDARVLLEGVGLLGVKVHRRLPDAHRDGYRAADEPGFGGSYAERGVVSGLDDDDGLDFRVAINDDADGAGRATPGRVGDAFSERTVHVHERFGIGRKYVVHQTHVVQSRYDRSGTHQRATEGRGQVFAGKDGELAGFGRLRYARRG